MSESPRPKAEDKMRAALKPWGWTCGPEFWQRYYTDVWIFQLANAVERLTDRVQELESRSRV